MKIVLAFPVSLWCGLLCAQAPFPDFLQGTWQQGDQEAFEHWDQVGDGVLKGISYSAADGRMVVSEYLEIARHGTDIVYSATVLGQNQGQPVQFTLSESDSAYTFTNPAHDFPQRIVYRPVNEREVLVQVSGGQEGFSYTLHKQSARQVALSDSMANPAYDAALAKRLGADDYGMKGYVLVVLKTGGNTTTDRELIGNAFRGHLENINRLVDAKKMIVAGPLGKNDKSYRGIFIFQSSMDETRALLQTDPAVKAGLLDVELYEWYGSAALPEYLDAADKIWKLEP